MPQVKVAYFDCFAGVSGDMTLGALVDLGVEPRLLEETVRGLGVTDFSLQVARVDRGGLGGTKVDVTVSGEQPERHLSDIEAILDRATLPARVREKARSVFRRLTEAEARAHQVAIERVHLHEVGALDAIVDVVGACVGLDALGVERVVCSTVTLGGGMAHSAHGAIPIPGPATVELLRGCPVVAGPIAAEMTTPTGAAIVATLATSFGPLPAMTVIATGYGAGTRDFRELPNLLRIVLGTAAGDARGDGDDAPSRERAVLIETNLDDLSPQVLAHAQALLLEGGALDVWTAPVVMKKGRAGHVLSVLASPDQAERLEAMVFRETTTIGLRRREVERRVLERELVEVETVYGKIHVKVAREGGRVLGATPEFDDCAAAARASGAPLRDIQAAAAAAWRATTGC